MIAPAPTEIRVCTLLIAGGGLLFLVVGLTRLAVEGGLDVLILPAVVAVLGLLLTAALLFRLPGARITAMVLAALVALVQLLLVLTPGPGPLWARVAIAAFAAANVYAFVLLNTAPARRYLGGTR